MKQTLRMLLEGVCTLLSICPGYVPEVYSLLRCQLSAHGDDIYSLMDCFSEFPPWLLLDSPFNMRMSKCV